jgi:fatty-acyl-CoA synthase
MRGFSNDPERTAEAIDFGRWMHTGDLATMDEHGTCGSSGGSRT